MSTPPKTPKGVLSVVIVLGLMELLTFYLYSLVWLAEGQPQRANDPTLRTWAFVYLTAMAVEPLLVIWWIVRSRRARLTQEKSDERSKSTAIT